jgi:hypothetical protein
MAIREILARNPQWVSPDDVKSYALPAQPDLAKEEKDIAERRAIVGSYRRALGWAARILEWPIIISTLLVTVATGWLGCAVATPNGLSLFVSISDRTTPHP